MCWYCKQTVCPSLCPNYIPPKANHYCCYCGEGIYEEKYLENEDGEYVHRDCIPDTDWLVNWLGYEFEEMELL